MVRSPGDRFGEDRSMDDASLVLLEIGGVVLLLALLARLAHRLTFPSVPFYLLAGLAFGNGGLLPLDTTHDFVELGGEIGLILLLFMLGLEYSARELIDGVRSSPLPGVVDLLNGLPGFAAGLLLGWGLLPAFLLGGMTYITSSGIVAKLLRDLRRERAPEARLVVSLLLVEDLAMAAFVPVAGALALRGGSTVETVVWGGVAVATVAAVLGLAVRLEAPLGRLLRGRTDEALLLSILGFVLIVAGLAESLRVSAAVGALLAGILLSGPIAKEARTLLSPPRDLFAAMFFFFEGLAVRPETLVPLLGAAVLLALAGAASKFATGWWAAARSSLERDERVRAGILLMPRGEFSVALAALGAAVEPRLVPLAVAYVIVLAVLTPVAYRFRAPVEPGGRSRLPPD
jgi:CPA2 family monovalent cation:H+ antiporter-2